MAGIGGEHGIVGSGAASGPIRVNAAEVSALASEVIRLWNVAGTLRPDRVLASVTEAVPGGLLGAACGELAGRWDRELADLQNALGYIADALDDSAHGYEQVEQGTARSFAASPIGDRPPEAESDAALFSGSGAW